MNRTITTATQLAALPNGAVVRSRYGARYIKHDDHWLIDAGSSTLHRHDPPALPARLLGI